MPETNPLKEILRQEILQNGPISFARFMEQALYHPDFGYYRRPRDPFGKKGDFYTAEQLQPVFGQLIQAFVEQMAQKSSIHPFHVVELGAGRAEMAPALEAWNYQAYDWRASALPSQFSGLILANEFFDALPVHVLKKTRDGFRELDVGWNDDKFQFVSGNIVSGELAAYTSRYGSAVPEDGVIEACLEAGEWLQTTVEWWQEGFFLILDYGYSAKELVRFPEGTLMSYRQHRVFSDVLALPGHQDITAHVNFTHLQDLAEKHGLECQEHCALSEWILRVWDANALEQLLKEKTEETRLQLKLLLFGMGETFRVLVLRKVRTKG